MNEAIAFDTHRFVKRLSENGFTEQQAEVLADEQVQLLNSNLATKADLFSVKAELNAKIEGIKADLNAKIEGVKADLLKWMIGALIAQSGLIVALIKLL